MTDEQAETAEDRGPLRKGWTTGACATAAAKAAFQALITGEFPDPVEITLPRGERPAFPLAERRLESAYALAGIVKDAGDDPDVTHGAVIRVEVRKGEAGSGISYRAGAGVGTVTRPGLPLEVGEPAINPAPRRMIADNLRAVAAPLGAPMDLEVTVSVENGEKLAEKTWNGRLGILGGLSILGTTGIVVPYSCSAWIASIRQAVDVARAAGWDHIAAATGSTSEAAIAREYGFGPERIVDMGDFAGGLLKYLATHPVARLTFAGGFAKTCKLAAGHLDLHSKRSQVDPAFLAELARDAGGAPDLTARIGAAGSAAEILAMAEESGLPLGDLVARRAKTRCRATTGPGTEIEVVVYDRAGRQVGRTPFGGVA